MKVYSNLIGMGVQTLMAKKKWESLVELVNKFNTVTNSFFASYLLPFVQYA